MEKGAKAAAHPEGGKKSKGKKTQAHHEAPTEQAKPRCPNTYRLEPRTKVQDCLVRDKAQAILTNKLQEATYDGASSPFLCASISEEILKAVKELDYDRYKYVVSVLIVEKANQAMICTWISIWVVTCSAKFCAVVMRGDMEHKGGKERDGNCSCHQTCSWDFKLTPVT
ncbi:dynein light chain Tctex-type protein 2 isoform X3 [Aphelocoma coerulescens]|uniref:dynein light chain Tctex-type protein 2 isoform X3 n=1 Tax=Aphelocoma coerulescens TaxID=39617 RepID=UPI003604CCAF